MMIHPWDAADEAGEWRAWLAAGRDFGQLVVNGPPGGPPLVLPTHFVLDERGEGDGEAGLAEVVTHFARPNPVWRALALAPRVALSVVDDYAYVPAAWRARDDEPPDHGVPTSYYAAVVLTGLAEIVDDPEEKARLLRRQLAHHEPAGGHAEVTVDGPPYGRQLSGIRGLRIRVTDVAAKFKYDGHRPEEQRRAVAARLVERGGRLDAGAARQQLRRLGDA
ncbi:FMN-binding negative transcriptional regulator [Streptomyces sp. 4N509B]|uniref:FMN-binding negative transcriptional regulator n=1 Tax=Streptomyces sp. 4N509B TaxID=3457413 RepID=UPI003FCF7EAB